MLKVQRFSLVLAALLSVFMVGAAFGQNYGGADATIGAIDGYTSTNFNYKNTYPVYGEVLNTNGGLVHVSATFVRPYALDLLSLRAKVTLPDGWVVDWDTNNIPYGLFSYYEFPSSAGSSVGVGVTPTYDPLIPGTFIYEGSGWGTPPPSDKYIKLNFDMYVPPGDRGDKTLDIEWFYTPTALGYTTNLLSSDNGQLIEDLNPTVATTVAATTAAATTAAPTTAAPTTAVATTSAAATTSTVFSSNVVDYTEGFEDAVDGDQITTLAGWSAAAGAGLITEAAEPVYAGILPLVGTHTHTNILTITGSDRVSNVIDSDGNTTVFTDVMLNATQSDTDPAIDTTDQLAFYVNDSSQLVIMHKANGTIDEWHALVNSPAIAEGEWVRITIEQNYDDNRYQIRVNEGDPIEDAKGYETSSSATPVADGTWFNMVQTDGAMSSMWIQEASYVDDLQVVTADPVPVVTTTAAATTSAAATTAGATTSAATTAAPTTAAATTAAATTSTVLSNTVDYAEGFEDAVDGDQITTLAGWSAAAGAGLITEAAEPVYAGILPLVGTHTHTNILTITGSDRVTNLIDSDGNATVFTDLMLNPTQRDSDPEIDTADQLAFYVNDSSQLVIMHKAYGTTDEWLALVNSPAIAEGEWVRITIEQNYDDNRYQIRVNEGDPIADSKGYATSSSATPVADGTWFNMVQTAGEMSSMSFREASYVDDLQVVTADPVPVVTTTVATTSTAAATSSTIAATSSTVAATSSTVAATSSTAAATSSTVVPTSSTVAATTAGATTVTVTTTTTTAGDGTFSGAGSGTEADPYQITNVAQLQEMNLDRGAYYVIMNNIDASDTANWNNGDGFDPIGVNTDRFVGTLDGNCHMVTGLYINRPEEDYVGLLGYVHDDGAVRGVRLVGADITGKDFVGALAGVMSDTNNHRLRASSCSSSGQVQGRTDVGGLLGQLYDASIEDCCSSADVTGDYRVGGLIGIYSFSSVYRSYATGRVDGRERVGGFAGHVGGLSGGIAQAVNCFAAGYVYASGPDVGGFVGYPNDGGGAYSDYSGSFYVDDANGDSRGIHEPLGPDAFKGNTNHPVFGTWDFVFTWQIVAPDCYPIFACEDINVVDYAEGFEDAVDGDQITTLAGWSAAAGAGLITEAAEPVYAGILPLVGTHTHTNILTITGSDRVSNLINSDGNTTVFTDLMLNPTHGTIDPAIDTTDQLAFYVNDSSQLVILHKAYGTTNEWHALVNSPAIAEGEWVRITIEQNYDDNRYQIRVNEGDPIADSKGYATSSSATPVADGTWFNMVQTAGGMSSIWFQQASYVDDLQVVTADPVPVVTTTVATTSTAAATSSTAAGTTSGATTAAATTAAATTAAPTTAAATTAGPTTAAATTAGATTTTAFSSNVVDYAEGFEDAVDGDQITTLAGWSAAAGAGLITEAAEPVYAGILPLVGTHTHTNILTITGSDRVTNLIDSDGNTTVFTDLMLNPTQSTIEPAIDTADQLAFYVNDSSQLVIMHKADGTTDEWHALVNSPVIAEGEWVRITIEQNYDDNRYQIRVNEGDPIEDAKGYETSSSATPVADGTWFNMVQTAGGMSSIWFQQASYVDDLQVVTSDPVPVVTTTVAATTAAPTTATPTSTTAVATSSTVAATSSTVAPTTTSVTVTTTTSTTAAGAGLNGPNDFAFLMYNSDAPDAVAFVLLSGGNAGETIYFTDDEWTGTALAGSEGTISWTVPAGGLPAGTVVRIDDISSTTPTATVGSAADGAGSLNLAADGDGLWAYMGSEGTPTVFLGLIEADAMDGNSTSNTGLGAQHILSFANSTDAMQYTGLRYGESAFVDYLTLIGDTSGNWETTTGDGTAYNSYDDTAFILGALPTSTTATTTTTATPTSSTVVVTSSTVAATSSTVAATSSTAAATSSTAAATSSTAAATSSTAAATSSTAAATSSTVAVTSSTTVATVTTAPATSTTAAAVEGLMIILR